MHRKAVAATHHGTAAGSSRVVVVAVISSGSSGSSKLVGRVETEPNQGRGLTDPGRERPKTDGEGDEGWFKKDG